MIERKSNTAITQQEWDTFAKAVTKLMNEGKYKELAYMHGDDDGMRKHRMHYTERFLPWHRAYLVVFERALRQKEPDAFIPYWDWEEDKGDMQKFKDFVGESRRAPRGKVKFLEILDSVSVFSDRIERGYHDAIHNWVGGTMRTAKSALDPAFWLHHAQIDRVWWRWQKEEGNHNKKPGDDQRKLDPWGNEFEIDNINDTSQLGNDSYAYE